MQRKHSRQHKPLIPRIVLFLLIVLTPVFAEAQTFNSGSNGSDGALDFTWAVPATGTRTVIFDPSDPATFDPASPRRLDVDNDNIFHFTTVLIPANVTVVLTATKLNWAPVYWLTTGDVVIETLGGLSLTGAPGHAESSQGEARFPSIPGPGGFPGGRGASALNPSQAGFGPGAGQPPSCDCNSASGSHVTLGISLSGVAGPIYGSPFLLPLVEDLAEQGDKATCPKQLRGLAVVLEVVPL